MSVPHDISIMGFDDLSFSSKIVPGLTTMAQDTARIAEAAVAHLLARLNGEPSPPETIVPMRLIIRSSTGAAPINHRKTTNKET